MADLDAPLREEWLQAEKAMGERPILPDSAMGMQEQMAQMVKMLEPFQDPKDETIQTHDTDANGIPIRIYTPKEAKSGAPLPICVFLHSGGFVSGDHTDQEDKLVRVVSGQLPCIVVSAGYRLGPQHKMPAMTDDCVSAFSWARANASSINGDANKMFTLGGSAGGNLSLTVAGAILSDPSTRSDVKAVVSLCPFVFHPRNVPGKWTSMRTAADGVGVDSPVIHSEHLFVVVDATDADPNSSYQWPGLFSDSLLQQFPPTYIAVCGQDPVRDDGIVMSKMLQEAGAKSKLQVYAGLPHYFWAFPAVEKTLRDQFYADTIDGLRWALGH